MKAWPHGLHQRVCDQTLDLFAPSQILGMRYGVITEGSGRRSTPDQSCQVGNISTVFHFDRHVCRPSSDTVLVCDQEVSCCDLGVNQGPDELFLDVRESSNCVQLPLAPCDGFSWNIEAIVLNNPPSSTIDRRRRSCFVDSLHIIPNGSSLKRPIRTRSLVRQQVYS